MTNEVADVDVIFSSAIEMATAEERDAFLAEACGDDDALRQQVAALVGAHLQADDGGKGPAVAVAPAPPPGRSNGAPAAADRPDGIAAPGTCVGPYKLLQRLGEGRRAVVFLAEQQSVRRLVALKIVTAGMDAQRVLARFEAEWPALALLNHPNIARVFDAGTVPGFADAGTEESDEEDGAAPARPSSLAGRPFFVMEPVEGIPLTRHCDEQRLSLRQRLELFVAVCQAVQHAHQKRVVHGDLKPSNVLVASRAGKPVPRVTDFGVARAVEPKLTEGVQSAGPLEYLSPEQAQFNALDIDTRSDVYSLGVLLYELLTGTTPLPRQRLKEASLTDALRLIREEEAPPPSTRLSESREQLAALAARRHTEPAALVKAVRGELDCVAMKALQKDRTNRYETASELARDVQRYLADEPVEAYPSSACYRLRKLARHYRRGLTLTVAALVLLLGAGVAGTGLAVWAMRAGKEARAAAQEAANKSEHALKAETLATEQRDRAEAVRQGTAKERDRALAAETAAKRSEQDTWAVLEFLQNKLLAAGHPKAWAGAYDKDVTLRKAADVAELEVASAFVGRPLVVASVREVLGSTYLDLGEAALAVKQYEQTLALRELILGPDHPATVACRNKLAVAYRVVGRTVEAGNLYNQRPNSAGTPPPWPSTARCCSPRSNTARPKGSCACLAIRQQLLPDDWITFDARSQLGEALLGQNKHADAEPLLLAGYEGLKKRAASIPPDARVRLTNSLERLVLLYEGWSKPNEATRWREELEAVKTAKNP